MSKLLAMMIKNKNIEICPPDNVVFYTSQDEMILKYSGNSHTYRKTNNGLAYVGYLVYNYEGTMWQAPMFVSTNREACFYQRDNSYDNVVSETTFRYKGKDWYWTTGSPAIGGGNVTTSADYYRIGGADFVFTGTLEETYLNSAKALLDYIYSFAIRSKETIDYVETRGTQYFDTGYVPTPNTRVVTKIKTTTTEQAIIVFGCANNAYYYYIVPYANAWYYGLVGSESHAGTYNAVLGEEYEIDFNNNGNIIINNDIIVSNISPTGNGNLLIANRTNNIFGKWQYETFKIYESGVLICDYVPTKITYQNNEIKYCLYDTITGRYNLGVGEIIGDNYEE